MRARIELKDKIPDGAEVEFRPEKAKEWGGGKVSGCE